MSYDNTKHKVIIGLCWKFSERILAQGISFILSIVLARILMPEEYGIVAMVNIFITIANVLTGGFSIALVQKKDANETDFSTIFFCNLAVSIVLYLLLFVSAPLIADFYTTPQITPVLRVFALKLIIGAYNSVQHAYVSRHMIFKKFFFSTLGGTLLSGVVGIILALCGMGVWALITQYLVNSIVDLLVLRFTVKWRPRLLFSLHSAKSLMNFGWKLLVADLIGILHHQLRSLLIGKFYTIADLAYYNKGKSFPELIINNVDSSISAVLFPAMSNAEGDQTKVKSMVRRSMKITSYVIFPMMIGMAVIAKPMILLLLTEKWVECVPYLQLICIAKAFSSVSNTNLQAMRALGRSDVILKLEFLKKPVGLLMVFAVVKINVLVIVVTLPVYSLYAAIINMQPNKKLMNYGFREQLTDLVPAFFLSCAMAIGTCFIALLEIPNLLIVVIQIIFGVGIYLGLSYLFKVDSFYYFIDYALKLRKRVQQIGVKS